MSGERRDLEDIAAAIVQSWLDTAGPALARQVADGRRCDSCARATLVTVGLAGGIGAARVARMLVDGYGRTLAAIVAERDRTIL
jgi:2-phosphoglycerate kinase